MRSTNHRKQPTRFNRNDFDFVPFADSSALVLLTRNAARFDGEFSATGQTAPAESILSGRAVAASRNGYMQTQQRCGAGSLGLANPGLAEAENKPVFCYRTTLFDSVMDFLDRHDRISAQRQSSYRPV